MSAIAALVRAQAPGPMRIGHETGPLCRLALRRLRQDGLPAIRLDARHAGLVLMADKADRNDAAGLVARIVRTGRFCEVRVRSEAGCVIRAQPATRTTLVGQRCEVDSQIRDPERNLAPGDDAGPGHQAT